MLISSSYKETRSYDLCKSFFNTLESILNYHEHPVGTYTYIVYMYAYYKYTSIRPLFARVVGSTLNINSL